MRPTLVVVSVSAVLAVAGICYAANPWTIETVPDPVGNVGGASLALTSGGEPRLAYRTDPFGTGGTVKYAARIAGVWNFEIPGCVAALTDVGEPALAVGPDDLPQVAYSRHAGGGVAYALEYLEYDGTTWLCEVVDTSDSPGGWKSLTLDSAGNPGIAYHAQYSVFDLRFAQRDATWTVCNVDTAGNVGLNPRVLFQSDDRPIIAYNSVQGGNNYDIKVADAAVLGPCGLGDWTRTTPITAGTTYVQGCTLDSTGNLGLLYWDPNTRELSYDGDAVYTSVGAVSAGVRLYNDEPRVVFLDIGTQELFYARNPGAGWAVETIATGVRSFSGDDALALGADGRVHVAFTDLAWNVLYAVSGFAGSCCEEPMGIICSPDSCTNLLIPMGGTCAAMTLCHPDHVGFAGWDAPNLVQPGEQVNASISWCYVDDGGLNQNAVTYVTVYADWQPDTPLATLVNGELMGPPRDVTEIFSFVAPQLPGTYRLRWNLVEAFAPTDSFCSHPDNGVNDPGCGRYAETTLVVCSFFDSDCDGDIDLNDFSTFANEFTGSQ